MRRPPSLRVPPVVANTLWYLLSVPPALAFHRARRDVAGTQRRLLLRLLRRNAGTAFGRRYGLASIDSVAAYRERVPLTSYEDYLADVERIGAGEAGVLTADPVLLLEPTSGSSAPTKLIPYTAALKAEFQRAIAPWIVDLFTARPGLLRGQAYWSVTPVARRAARTPGGLPIGFEDDSDYLGGLGGALARAAMAVPSLVRSIEDVEAFRYTTLLFLLRSRSLALISIWNPTFLTLLVSRLGDWWRRLAADVGAGTLSPPAPLDADLRRRLSAGLVPDRGRAAAIAAAFATGDEPGAIHARLWPHLRVISLWTEAQAASYVPQVARLFPQAQLQGKGLIATEGIVSVPLLRAPLAAPLPRSLASCTPSPVARGAGSTGAGAPPLGVPSSRFRVPSWRSPPNSELRTRNSGLGTAILAVRSHFFEFLPAESAASAEGGGGDGARTLLAHQLERGGHYRVIVTTGGGLYRYQLHDLVSVTGHLGACPLLRFEGKESLVADWFGEKLNERHVRRALETLFARHAVRPTFAMLACDARPPGAPCTGGAYTLYVEAAEASDEALRAIGPELERALQENYHYRYCRDLGQLDHLRVFRISGGALEHYEGAARRAGQRIGDLKPLALHRLGGFSDVFPGRLL